jgi:hypothetical protein
MDPATLQSSSHPIAIPDKGKRLRITKSRLFLEPLSVDD